MIYKARIEYEEKKNLYRLFRAFFSPDLSRGISLENVKDGDPRTVTLALTENSNVAQTLGAHLRRKRAAVTSFWIRDEKVNQSLVTFSRRCIPHDVCWFERRNVKEDFALIGRKFLLLRNLLFMQNHLSEIIPHSNITANPTFYLIRKGNIWIIYTHPYIYVYFFFFKYFFLFFETLKIRESIDHRCTFQFLIYIFQSVDTWSYFLFHSNNSRKDLFTAFFYPLYEEAISVISRGKKPLLSSGLMTIKN